MGPDRIFWNENVTFHPLKYIGVVQLSHLRSQEGHTEVPSRALWARGPFIALLNLELRVFINCLLCPSKQNGDFVKIIKNESIVNDMHTCAKLTINWSGVQNLLITVLS